MLASLDVEPSIVHSGRNEQTLGRDCFAPVETDDRIVLVERKSAHRRRNGKSGAELVCLNDGTVGQLTAGKSGRKSQVVLNSHAAPGLASRCRAFNDEGPESFGGPVH